MKHGLFRLRRAAVTLSLGVGAIGGVIGVAGVAGAATPPTPPKFTLTATSQPHLSVGLGRQTAGTWRLRLTGTKANGWAVGDSVVIKVGPASGSCSVYLASTPTATVTMATKSATPTVAASIASATPCSEPDELTVKFTNSGRFTTTTGAVTIAITGVKYTVTSTTPGPTGTVQVTAQYDHTSTSTPIKTTLTSASNAIVGGFAVTADTPPVTVPSQAYDALISPISIGQWPNSEIQAGYVCISLTSGNFFNTTAMATATETGGTGSATATVNYLGTKVVTTTASTAVFQVTKPSATHATFTVSGLKVNAEKSTGGAVTVAVTHSTSATCTSTAPVGSTTAFTIGKPTAATRIYGGTADATAVAELEHEYPPEPPTCVPSGSVVLATDENYPDALAGAYLARYLRTGTLLTPTNALSSTTLNAIREEGIGHVYVVGGPLAVSTTVVHELESTPAYTCGGATTRTTSGKPVELQVTRIFGQTEYDTAEDVAQYVPATHVGSLDIVGAYGHYNDTTGTESSAPSTYTSLPTAILATGQSFPDAESASTMAYAESLPILLTTPTSLSSQVATTVGDLGVKQVIVMGGPLAISNGVVSTLEKLGVAVLRIAGQDYTDTAVQLADFETGSTASRSGLGWMGTSVAVARGDFYTDGLAGAVVAGAQPEPLLLTENPSTVGKYLTAFLKSAGSTGVDGDPSDKISSVNVLGGPVAVSTAAVSAMESDLSS